MGAGTGRSSTARPGGLLPSSLGCRPSLVRSHGFPDDHPVPPRRLLRRLGLIGSVLLALLVFYEGACLAATLFRGYPLAACVSHNGRLLIVLVVLFAPSAFLVHCLWSRAHGGGGLRTWPDPTARPRRHRVSEVRLSGEVAADLRPSLDFPLRWGPITLSLGWTNTRLHGVPEPTWSRFRVPVAGRRWRSVRHWPRNWLSPKGSEPSPRSGPTVDAGPAPAVRPRPMVGSSPGTADHLSERDEHRWA